MRTNTSPLPIAVLISGGGTTLRNLITLQAAGELNMEIRLVISSDPQALGLARAQEAKIPTHVVQKKRILSSEAYSEAIFGPCRQAGVELVVMGGFLKHVEIPGDFINRVMNIHPSLIPAFCGHGMYGHYVHEAVLASGAKISGCTVHFVDNEFDHGPIILQSPVEVMEDDCPSTLAARVFAEECQALPKAIQLFAAGRLQIERNRVRVLAE